VEASGHRYGFIGARVLNDDGGEQNFRGLNSVQRYDFQEQRVVGQYAMTPCSTTC